MPLYSNLLAHKYLTPERGKGTCKQTKKNEHFINRKVNICKFVKSSRRITACMYIYILYYDSPHTHFKRSAGDN